MGFDIETIFDLCDNVGFKIICNKCGNEVELKNRDDGYEKSVIIVSDNYECVDISCSKCKNGITLK